MKENTKSGGQQQGSTEATTIIKAINLGDVQFSDAMRIIRTRLLGLKRNIPGSFN